jgi:glycosyltransferase involved in cell wall biosynthesis
MSWPFALCFDGGILDMRLTILIPCYNEVSTILPVLAMVCAALPHVEKEILVVDDYSTDGTRALLQKTFTGGVQRYGKVIALPDGGLDLAPAAGGVAASIEVLYHAKNQGKGAALRTAMAKASGDVIVIQDADFEYDPQDWSQMYNLIAERKVADVVYGSRFYGRPHRSLFFHHFMANRLISFLFNVLYNQTLTDIEVCYKMFTREVAKTLSITCNDFGIEVEVSAQIARNRTLRIYEVGICYYGRTYVEGKKINWRDGVKALWYLLKFRF